MADNKTIEVNDVELGIIELIRKRNQMTYEAGFDAGEQQIKAELYQQRHEAFEEGREAGRREALEEMNIPKLAELIESLMWTKGDKPEKDGEYLVETKELPSVIILSYEGGEWQTAKKNRPTILKYRTLPASNKED